MNVTSIAITFYFFFFFRLMTVIISARNEKKLKHIGAREYGSGNSKLLMLFHFAYYASGMIEGFCRDAFYTDTAAISGLLLYVFSIAMLYTVIAAIRHVWTVKLIIAPVAHHKINRNLLFRLIKHPNYFLNIIPELIGTALIFHAWYTLLIGFPVYLIPLIRRIREEEALMTRHFVDYRR